MAFTQTGLWNADNRPSSSTSVTSASATPSANSLLIVGLGSQHDGNSADAEIAVSGGGLTWNDLHEIDGALAPAWDGNAGWRMDAGLYYASVGGSPSSTTLTGSSNIGSTMSLVGLEITGHDTASPIVQSNVFYETTGGSGNNIQVTLPSAVTTDNLLVCFMGSSADDGGGFTTPDTNNNGRAFTDVYNQDFGTQSFWAQSYLGYRLITSADTNVIRVNATGQDVGTGDNIGAHFIFVAEIALASGGTSASVTPTVVISLAGAPSPTVTAASSASIGATVVNGVTAIASPTVTAASSATITPTVVNTTATIPTPGVSTSSQVAIAATVVNALGSVFGPTVSAQTTATITPSSITLTSSVPLPGASGGTSASISATTVAATSTIPAPGVTASSSASVTASVIGATTTIPTPTGPTGAFSITDVPWTAALWTDAPGYAEPADLSNVSTIDDLGGGTWTVDNTPRWHTDPWGYGKPGIEFAAGERFRRTVTGTHATRTAVVVGSTSGPDCDLIDSSTAGSRTLLDRSPQASSGNVWRIYTGGTPQTGGTTDTDIHLFIVEFNQSGNDTLEVDGVQVINADSGTGATPTEFFVGNSNADSSYIAFGGYIERALTAQERSDIEAWYDVTYVNQPPPPFGAPQNFTTFPELTQINLSWDAVTDAVGYRVYRDAADISGLIGTTTYTDTDRTQGVLHDYYVIAEKADTTQSAPSTTISERASFQVQSVKSSVVRDDDPSSNSVAFTGCGIPDLPAYVAYFSNMRQDGEDFYWRYFGPAPPPPRDPMYSYLGPWADGVEVEFVSGTQCRVIEWERGSQSWRETDLDTPGQRLTIDLSNTTMNGGGLSMEGEVLDNVLFENGDATNVEVGWVIKLWNWYPAPLPVEKLTLDPGDGQITANWVSEWLDYEVRIDGGSWIDVGAAQTYTFTGLTNGDTHTIEVRHDTPIGFSDPVLAVGSARAGFHITDISWVSALWASESSMVSTLNDGDTLKRRPTDRVVTDLTGIPGGTWAPRNGAGTTWTANIANTGRPAFRFASGVDTKLTRQATGEIQSNGTFVTIGRVVSGSPDFHDGMTGSTRRALLDVDTNGKFRIFNDPTSLATTADADTDLHLFITEFGATDSLEIDGVQVISGDAGTDQIQGVVFGSGLAGAHTGVSEVAFGAYVDRSLTTQEKSDLLSWFQTEYVLPAGTTVTPSTVAATVTVPSPSVTASTDVTITPGAITATATVLAPSVTASSAVSVTPTVVTSLATVAAPSVEAQTSASVTANVIGAISTVLAPAVTGQSDVTVSPTVVASVVVVPSPRVGESVLSVGSQTVQAIKVGSTDVSRAYVGSTLIYGTNP